jgi:AcrR family transcriptional regulator
MKEEKQEKMVAAALKLFEEKGYHVTKVSDIVAEAGVAQGTFYLYFKSKEEMFRAMAEACLNEIAAALEQGQPSIAANSGVCDVIEATLKVYYHNKSILRIIYKHGTGSNELADITGDFYRRMMEMIKGFNKITGRYPDFTEDELEIAAYAHIGMVETAAYQWFVVKSGGQDEIGKLVRVLSVLCEEADAFGGCGTNAGAGRDTV